MISAIETYAADPTVTSWTDGTVKCSTSSVTADGSVADAFTDANINIGTMKMKSTKYGTCDIKAEKDATTGFIKFTFTNSDVQSGVGR
jgi:hypothetical protein